MHSWGKFGPESYKETKKPNSSFWGAWSNSRVVHMSHTTLPRGCAKHLSHSLGLTPGHISTLTPYKEQAYPSCGASKQGSLLFVLTFSCCSRGPSEAMSEFVVWPLVNFCWLGEVQEPWLGRVTSPSPDRNHASGFKNSRVQDLGSDTKGSRKACYILPSAYPF